LDYAVELTFAKPGGSISFRATFLKRNTLPDRFGEISVRRELRRRRAN